MKRSGGKAGRPFGEWKIDQLEKHVTEVPSMDELYAIRAELGFRHRPRAQQLKSLVDRIIREQTGSFDPNAHKKKGKPTGPDEWFVY